MVKAQVLVVEDDALIARNIQLELHGMGYAVPAIATSGEEALQKAAEIQPDLVLMDISLRGEMDGVKTVERLREDLEVPVIYLTAFADDQTLQRAKKTEPYGYLIKPYEEKELHTTVQLALYKHKMDRLLKENQEWLATILRCIGDGVIVTDAAGCVRVFNRMAEMLTGWRQEEAVGTDLLDVFSLLHGRSRQPLAVPAPRALRAGASVRLDGHSVLVGKGGKETPVEGSVAPVVDGRGGFAGFVLVFRDRSQSGMR